MAILLRVRVPDPAPATASADVIQPKFRYVNGLHEENGNQHVTPVENNEIKSKVTQLKI